MKTIKILKDLNDLVDELEALKFQLPWSEKYKILDLKDKSNTLILSLSQTIKEEELNEIKQTAKEFIGVVSETINQIKIQDTSLLKKTRSYGVPLIMGPSVVPEKTQLTK